jgi:PII-like signaling protein
MNGYRLSFFTTLGKRVHHKQLHQWLIDLARDTGIRGATVYKASEGYGHDRHFHSAKFFDTTDEPIEVVMVLSTAEADSILQRIDREKVELFYVKVPAEFGMLGATHP